MSSMVITCGDCGARFHLDPALLKDSSAARIRCRKCGGLIVVRLHEESPVPVLPPQETIPPSTVEPAAPTQEPVSPWPVEPPAPAQEWVSPWPVEPPAPAQEPPAFEPDISGVVRSEPGEQTPDKMPVRSGEETQESVPPELPGPIHTRREDLFDSPAMDSGPDQNPSEENSAEEIVPPVPERQVFSGGRSYTLKYFIISGLSILLLVGATLYFGTSKAGRKQMGKLFPGWGSMGSESAAGKHAYDIRDVIWSFEKQTASGSLFVIKGKVANFGKGPSGGIRIRATLLGKDNQVLAGKMAFAGNLLDEASLRQMDRPGIAEAMSNRFGEGNVNKEIPPGKALPFMVVFFDPPGEPGEIEAVMVEAVDAR